MALRPSRGVRHEISRGRNIHIQALRSQNARKDECPRFPDARPTGTAEGTEWPRISIRPSRAYRDQTAKVLHHTNQEDR